jgi:hypothetical protein
MEEMMKATQGTGAVPPPTAVKKPMTMEEMMNATKKPPQAP